MSVDSSFCFESVDLGFSLTAFFPRASLRNLAIVSEDELSDEVETDSLTGSVFLIFSTLAIFFSFTSGFSTTVFASSFCSGLVDGFSAGITFSGLEEYLT